MSGFAVIGKDGVSYICEDGDEDGLFIVQNLEVPFTFKPDSYQIVCGGSCGEWAYIYGSRGAILLWNSITPQPQQLHLLDPPDFVFPDESQLCCAGLGYDAKSHHYKLMRNYVDGYEIENLTEHFEVCILDLGHNPFLPEWKEIERPEYCNSFGGEVGVYVNATGRCYWRAYYNDDLPEIRSQNAAAVFGSPIHRSQLVVSFDFATERFHNLPFPAAADLGKETTCTLVACHGSLGALVYDNISPSSPGFSTQLHVWSLKKRLWEKLYHVSSLDHVAKPLCLKDNRFMFLESKPPIDCDFSQLLVYDFKAEKVEKINIYAGSKYMVVFSYAKISGPPLPVSQEHEGEEEEAEEKLDIYDDYSEFMDGYSYAESLDLPLVSRRKRSQEGEEEEAEEKLDIYDDYPEFMDGFSYARRKRKPQTPHL